VPTSPATVPLSQAMRAGSADAHRAAEGTRFVAALLDGRVSGEGYAAYLRRLRTVYATLEALLRASRVHPTVAAVWDASLERLEAVDADLAHWLPGETAVADDSPATAAYAHRLHEVGSRPHLLLAHHYTRYLGDLAGGQVIGRTLERHYALDGRGLAFYDFPGVGRPVPYRRAYRERVDALPLSAAEQREVVDEVVLAFGLNRDLLEELDRQLVG
jgi:heme oxygenase